MMPASLVIALLKIISSVMGDILTTEAPRGGYDPTRPECARQNDSLTTFVLNQILAGYDKKTVPKGNGVDVGVDVIIQGINEISEATQSFVLDILFSQVWDDPGLRYDDLTSCLENITLSYRMIDEIWIPNVCFQNSKHSVVHQSPTPNIFLLIYPSGRLWVNYRYRTLIDGSQ